MLSTRSAEVVKATLPVIGAAIGDITPVFYRRMFAAHPELERDLFNRGNQAQGDQQTRARRRDRGLRHPAGGRGRPRPARRAGPHRAQARLARHHRGPVPDRPRAPVRRHRRGARRRGHPRGRRGLGRGLLADGRRPDHDREAPVRRDRRRRRRRLAHPGPAPASAGVARHRVLRPRLARRQPAAARPAGPVRLGPGARCPTAPARSASTASPTRRGPATGASRSRRSGRPRPTAARSSRRARCRTSCTTTSSRATRSASRLPSATWSWRTRRRRWC